jgi:hypothetical protein
MKLEEKHRCNGKDILVTYTGESSDYRSARVMYIKGRQDARPGTVGTIESPQQARGIIIDSGIPDVKVFSFTFRGKLRQLLVKISTEGEPISCTIRLVKPCSKGKWESLSGDVTLVDENGNPILFNPRGLAEWGDLIYLIDYETQNIVILGADELEGMAGPYTPLKAPFYLGSSDNLQGQAIIILNDKLFALYLREGVFGHGLLYRLAIGGNGSLIYEASVAVGSNPQSIIPVYDGNEMQLLIPAIGGMQNSDGTINEYTSNISCVPALGSWSYIFEGPNAYIVADSNSYDIHAVAAGTRGRSSMLYILTQIYITDNNDTQSALWKIYATTVGQFLDLGGGPTPPQIPITDLVNNGTLAVTDEGEVTSLEYGGIYFWDLMYGQTPEVGDAGDLLWAVLGTPLLATRAAEGGYGSPTSEEQNPYVMFGFNGGNNVNSIDLTIEAIQQAKRGLSLKRCLCGSELSVPVEQEGDPNKQETTGN